MADFFSRRFRLSRAASAALWVVAIVVSFGWSVYPDVRAELARPPSESSTWLDRFHEVGARPDDLIMSDNPEIPAVYLGPVHYWVRAHNFERYSYQDGDRIRHLYTGGLRVATEDEFRQIVASLGNRTLWYVGRGGVSQISDTILAASEVVLPAVEDQPMILKIVSSVAR
jgi:hypothetical protein